MARISGQATLAGRLRHHMALSSVPNAIHREPSWMPNDMLCGRT
ncbi:hypothetical protein [Thalassoroseus pseudoceratinae]|nr:hypothetical protein [Thalassoroseus pseudoceratinae]